MAPELQLMRWVKCMVARELPESSALLCWDFVFGGVFDQVVSKYQAECCYLHEAQSLPNFKQLYATLDGKLAIALDDPYLNLEVLCAAMIL